MKKILLLSHIFPPAVDGGSRVIFKIGQYLENENYQTLYLSSDCSSTDDFTKSKYKKISTIYNLPVRQAGLRSKIYLPVYHHLRCPLKFINLFLPKNSYLHNLLKVFQKGPIFKIIPFIKTTIKIIKFKPDLIIAGPLPTTIILYANSLKKITNLYNRITNFPSILQGRGLRGGFCRLLANASFHQTDQDFFQKPLIKTLQQADYLWALTHYETNFFIKKLNINPKKVILAGNGIDPEFLKNTSLASEHLTLKKERDISPSFRQRRGPGGRFNILFIGSLSAHKGLDLLIKSFSTIYNLRPTKLILAGQKTLYYPEILKIIKQQPKEVQKNIKLVFSFPQKKLKQLVDNCDVLVLPSNQESFGLVLIEAWARQKPVITSDIPSLKEIVTQTQGGLIFKSNNISDLTDKINQLFKSSKIRQQLGKNGYNYVKNNYTWPIVTQKICQKVW